MDVRAIIVVGSATGTQKTLDGNGTSFDFVRVVETGHEVVVTYNATRRDGSRFRNTEVLTFVGEQVAEVEVYFGWNLAPQPS